MSTGGWVAILGAQVVVSAIMAVALYHRLRSKLRRHKEMTERLIRMQKQEKRRFDERTRKVLALVAQTRTTSWQIASEIRELKASSELVRQVHQTVSLESRGLRIIITTLPKVGSSSVDRILRNAFSGAVIEKTHGVSLEGQAALAKDIQASPEGYTRDALLNNFHQLMAVRTELDRMQHSTPPASDTYFICGTREPIGWALSMLFQLLEMGTLSIDKAPLEDAQRIVTDWLSGRPLWQWTPAPGEWMRREIEGYLGVDPMKLGFDQARGFQVMECRRGRLLLLRYENFDRLPEALGTLLTAPANLFQDARSNVTGEKKVGSLYRQLAADLRFPRSFVERVYSDPYATTFYSPEELRRFADQWSQT